MDTAKSIAKGADSEAGHIYSRRLINAAEDFLVSAFQAPPAMGSGPVVALIDASMAIVSNDQWQGTSAGVMEAL